MRKLLYLVIIVLGFGSAKGQPVPAVDENIPFLQTFGKEGSTEWGDDDFSQIIFFSIPKDYTKSVYIRVFDADISGENDEQKEAWNTKMTYFIYGGSGACSNEDARKIKLSGNYKSGNLIDSKVFGESTKYDNQWYTFGPLNPTEGELMPDYGGNIFKIIIEEHREMTAIFIAYS